MYTAKQKLTHTRRKQINGSQRGEGRGRGKLVICDEEIQTTMCKIDKQQGVSHSTGNYNCLWYTEKILNTMLYTQNIIL